MISLESGVNRTKAMLISVISVAFWLVLQSQAAVASGITGLCTGLTCSVSNPTRAIDSDLANSATRSNPVGLLDLSVLSNMRVHAACVAPPLP
jgi:multisubunit Na+/H+ antiporter MnhE subunit